MVLPVEEYAGQLEAARQRIKRLKDRHAARTHARQERKRGREEAGGAEDAPTEAASAASQAVATVQKLVATYLLQPDLQLPIESQTVHKKILKTDKGQQYEAALAECSGATIQSVLQDMAAAEKPPFKVERDADSRLYVDELDNGALLRLTGQSTAAGLPQESLPQPPAPSLEVPRAQLGQQQHSPQPFGSMAGGPPGPASGQMLGPNGLAFPPGFPPGLMAGGRDRQAHALARAGPSQAGLARGGAGLPLSGLGQHPPPARPAGGGKAADLEALLAKPSVQDRVKTERGEELLDLLQKPTAKQSATSERFRTAGGTAVREYCPYLTKVDCCRMRRSSAPCGQLHFQRVIQPWTDLSLGNCSYLDTCRNMRTCKYIHYVLDDDSRSAGSDGGSADTLAQALERSKAKVPAYLQALPEPQWITCDVRKFNMKILGKFGVIMADPPWEIHQELPYGTMADDEMRQMDIGSLQDDGVIFLWVTGRAMELGRECLDIWGYRRVDELIWVKTNQLQRLIRTGRTGHWLNHSKEHCLVGVKGSPEINRGLDCDVLVADVRETSRKPDEMYPLLERLSPGTRKLEIFARPHNVRPGWVCLGNQLDGTRIQDPDMLKAYVAAYGEPAPQQQQQQQQQTHSHTADNRRKS